LRRQAKVAWRHFDQYAKMEALGIPVDVETHRQLLQHRRAIRAELLEEAGATFGIYDEDQFDTDGIYDEDQFDTDSRVAREAGPRAVLSARPPRSRLCRSLS
jgi:hypothetical protein